MKDPIERGQIEGIAGNQSQLIISKPQRQPAGDIFDNPRVSLESIVQKGQLGAADPEIYLLRLLAMVLTQPSRQVG